MATRIALHSQTPLADIPFMPRFFCDQPLEAGQLLTLPEAVARHMQVLRLREADAITIFNGQGGEYHGSLTRLERKSAQVMLSAFSAREAEPAHGLVLAQALPEGTKMDWIVEKAVELGATGIQPLMASRSVVRLDPERAAKKRAHWLAIMTSAAEQCGRNRLPQLAEPLPFGAWLAQPDGHPRLLLSPRGQTSLCTWAREQGSQAITLIIGPEGGWSDAEEQMAVAAGALKITLGERILRTETAGLAAIAALQAMRGEL